MNNNYRLQLRHGAETKVFSTRDEVFGYIQGQLQYGGVSLLPYEPVLFFYGKEDAKNTIIMVGLPKDQTNDGKSYFIIDTADLESQIQGMDGKYDEAIKALEKKCDEIEGNLNQEIDDRVAADEAEAETRAAKDEELEKAIEDEADTREKADEDLQNSIDFVKADLESVIEACGLVYNAKLADDRVSYEPDTHDEIIRDAQDIADAVDKISKFAAKVAQDLKVNVDNTDTVKLTLTPNEKDGGNVLTADVKLAGTEGLSKKSYDNNIIGKTSEGLYASVSIEPSTTNPNKLILKTSGYIDGKFVVDAFETEIDLTSYKGDTGKTTGINVSVDADKNVISAELNLASNKSNILKLEDGEYIVEGLAKNIKYGDSNVAATLKGHTTRLDEIEDAIDFVKAVDVKGEETATTNVSVEKSAKGDFTVSSNVKLSTDRSIIIANGGLQANVSASFKEGTSTLTISVGNNEYAIDLSALAVSVLEKAEYDSATEEIVLTFRVGDTLKTLRIPVDTLIHDIDVDDTDTIDLTLKSVAGGPNRLSAELRVDKSHSDNILTVNSNGAYVSKAFITDAVKEESDARKEADTELKAKLSEVSELANTNKEAIQNEANTARAAEKANADKIAQEIIDARAAEKANADKIAENKAAIEANETAIDAEEGRAKAAEQANATAITAEETRAKAAETKNASDINAEITRATEKEADLLEKIGANTEKIGKNEADIATANEGIDANSKAITAEAERAKLAEQANANAIATEIERAKTAESELLGKIESAQTTADSAKSVADKASTDLVVEIERSKAADSELLTKVGNAQSVADDAKSVADKTSADLAVEVERAKAAEEANATAIAKEIADARKAEEEIKADLLGAIANEEKRATEKENDLLEDIQKNATDIEGVKTEISVLADEVGNIELKSEGNLTYALYVNGTKHGEIIIPKDQFLKSVNYNPSTKELIFVFNTADGDVTTSISIADLVDTYVAGEGLSLNGNAFSVDFNKVASLEALNNAVNAEKERAKAAEEANATAIAKESADAREKEGLISADVKELQDKVKDLDKAFGVEIQISRDAEQANATAIAKEIEDAQHREQDLRDAIDQNTNQILDNKNNIKVLADDVNNIALNPEGDLAYGLYVNGIRKGGFTIPKDQFLKSVNYDPTTKELIFVFNTSEGESTTKISIADLVNTYEAGNGLVLNGNVFSVDNTIASKDDVLKEEQRALKAEGDFAKALDETNKLVKENHDNIDLLNIAVSKKADALNVYTKSEVDTQVGGVNAEISKINDKLLTKANVSEVYSKGEVDAKVLEVKTDVYSKGEVDAKLVTIDTALEGKANASEVYTQSEVLEKFAKKEALDNKANVTDVQLTYATKEDLQNVKDTYAKKDETETATSDLDTRVSATELALKDIQISYNPATSELVFTNSKGESQTYQLYSGSLVKNGRFDTLSNSIVLTVETAGKESEITIPVSELLSEVTERISTNEQNIQDIKDELKDVSKKWKTENSATISFTKSTTGEEDVLSGSVILASSNKQAIQVGENGGLYVSNDLEDYTCVFGEEGTISGQTAISKLLTRTGKVEDLAASNKERIEKIEQNVKELSDGLNELKETVKDQGRDLAELTKTVSDLKILVESIVDPEGATVPQLKAEIEKIRKATGYDEYVNKDNMKVRLDSITDGDQPGDIHYEITNIQNTIGTNPSEGEPKEGTIWYELTHLIDAGEY